MNSMCTHYLVLASCVAALLVCIGLAWVCRQIERYDLTFIFGGLAVLAVLFGADELTVIRKKRNDRFKQPPLTTERG
ncbi:hypothetical protein [Stenotrophomonas geniculata]|uniref:hypothetical protein n=1 Tax=Stenotrophomonas geniculata TaxID=86188 RepID=UPI002E7A265B|nr:hypothetical protein [Stenotrophomonas geniculata]